MSFQGSTEWMQGWRSSDIDDSRNKMFEMHLLTALLLLFDFEDRSTSIDDGSRRDVMTQRLSSDVATCLFSKEGTL